MVKTIASIILSFLFLIGISVYEDYYVKGEFFAFGESLQTLYDKTEEETATAEDALSVRKQWEKTREKVHVWVPHNDVNSIDNWLNETVGLIREGEYKPALPKIVVLIEMSKNVPSAYSPTLENIF